MGHRAWLVLGGMLFGCGVVDPTQLGENDENLTVSLTPCALGTPGVAWTRNLGNQPIGAITPAHVNGTNYEFVTAGNKLYALARSRKAR